MVNEKRLRELQRQVQGLHRDRWIIVYMDGHSEKRTPPDCIDALMQHGTEISEIRGTGYSKKDGHLAELLNSLLDEEFQKEKRLLYLDGDYSSEYQHVKENPRINRR